MKFISDKENLVEGEYYMEFCFSGLHQLFLSRYDEPNMTAISKVEVLSTPTTHRLILDDSLEEYRRWWPLDAIHGTLYELNDEEVLQCVVMEEL